MVSLCGLALSSLFVVNSKSVVHADAVNDANNQNNNAISWDSNSDKAQQVQNDSGQSSVQKADDNQQNLQSVQPSRAETSNVESSSAARPLTNQIKSVQVSNVNDAQKTNPIVINSPAGDKVNVHYVNRNGGEISDSNVKDTAIDASKTGQGSYQIPSGYAVNNPSGKYDVVNNGPINGTNLKGSVEHHEASVNYGLGEASLDELDPSLNKTLLTHANDLKAGNSWYLIMRGEWNKTFQDFCDNYSDHSYVINQLPTGNPSIENDDIDTEFYGNGNHDKQTVNKVMAKMRSFYNEQPNVAKFIPADPKDRSSAAQLYEPLTLLSKTEAYDEQHLPVGFVDSNNNLVGMIQNYSGKVGTTQNVNLTLPTGYKLADGQTMPASVTFANNTKPLLIKVAPSGQTNSVRNPANNKIHVHFVDQTTGKDAGGDYDIDLTKMQNGTNYYATPNGYTADNGGAFESKHFIKTYKVPTRTRVTLSDGAYFYDSWQNYGSATPVDAINQIFKTLGASDATKLSVSLSYAPILYDDDGYTYTGVQIKNDTNGKTCIVSEDERYTSDWQRVAALALVQHLVDDDYGNAIYLTGHVILTRTPLTYSSSFTDNYHPIINGTVTVPVHKSNSKSFIDNSGNAISANGNIVDVALTKKSDVDPSKVDPNSPGYKITHSSATRTIQINFPDQIPTSYKNIVNDKGVLTQTVNFTRDATVDTLLDPSDLNYVISEGAWKSDNKDPNFIGFEARTLPRIPGYTLSIKPF